MKTLVLFLTRVYIVPVRVVQDKINNLCNCLAGGGIINGYIEKRKNEFIIEAAAIIR